MKERRLPDTMKNCAWVFDMIPMEVSTVLNMDGYSVELPFYTVVASNGEKLMGARCLRDFHGFFPIRFNYDDTFHAAGNMSIQLHPGEKFLTENHNELGRQDESYYIVATVRARAPISASAGMRTRTNSSRRSKRANRNTRPWTTKSTSTGSEANPACRS